MINAAAIRINGKNVTKITCRGGLVWERVEAYLRTDKDVCWVTDYESDLLEIYSNQNWKIE